jgi:hypothetical protein
MIFLVFGKNGCYDISIVDCDELKVRCCSKRSEFMPCVVSLPGPATNGPEDAFTEFCMGLKSDHLKTRYVPYP